MSHMQPHVASCRLTLSHAVSCSLMRPRAVNDEDTLTGALEVDSVFYNTTRF